MKELKSVMLLGDTPIGLSQALKACESVGLENPVLVVGQGVAEFRVVPVEEEKLQALVDTEYFNRLKGMGLLDRDPHVDFDEYPGVEPLDWYHRRMQKRRDAKRYPKPFHQQLNDTRQRRHDRKASYRGK